MADHHSNSEPRQLITQAGVLPYQLDQLGPNGHGNRLRGSGAARRAFSDRRGGNRPIIFWLLLGSRLQRRGGLRQQRSWAFLCRSWLRRGVRGQHFWGRRRGLHTGWYGRRGGAGNTWQTDIRRDQRARGP